MKLYTSTTSPYARMVMLAALARGMDELQLAYVDPWTTPAELTAINPLSQVPTLIADNGTIITNSPLILDYLFDHPFRGAQQAALAGYGYELLDQVVKAYSLARFQPENTPAHPHIARARDAVARGLAHCPPLDPASNEVATHVLGMALSYAELRHGDLYRAHLSAANQQAFATYCERPDVRAVAIAQLEQHPASIGELRRAVS